MKYLLCSQYSSLRVLLIHGVRLHQFDHHQPFSKIVNVDSNMRKIYLLLQYHLLLLQFVIFSNRLLKNYTFSHSFSFQGILNVDPNMRKIYLLLQNHLLLLHFVNFANRLLKNYTFCHVQQYDHPQQILKFHFW